MKWTSGSNQKARSAALEVLADWELVRIRASARQLIDDIESLFLGRDADGTVEEMRRDKRVKGSCPNCGRLRRENEELRESIRKVGERKHEYRTKVKVVTAVRIMPKNYGEIERVFECRMYPKLKYMEGKSGWWHVIYKGCWLVRVEGVERPRMFSDGEFREMYEVENE
jgi:hypothetical protein